MHVLINEEENHFLFFLIRTLNAVNILLVTLYLSFDRNVIEEASLPGVISSLEE